MAQNANTYCNNSNDNNTKISTLVKIAIFVSIFCIVGPIAIPLNISPVPISIIHLALYLSIYILNYKSATYATVIYLLLGIIGLPIFSGYTGGLQVLLGPTGGYLLSFILMPFVIGLFINKFSTNKPLIFLGYLLGNIICYTFGTIWLAFITHSTIKAALLMGVIPYLTGDFIKIIIAINLFPKLSKRLSRHPYIF